MTGVSEHQYRDLNAAKRIVLKVGSSLLIEADGSGLRRSWLDALAEDIAQLCRQGKEVLVVSSGAIGLGRRLLDLPKGVLKLEDSQAAAASGQIQLAHAYQDALGRHDLKVAQILLTSDDTEQRRRYLNARRTIDTLLMRGSVPIINENDTVATDEIRFGDNDRLAARVAAMVGADHLVILSDIDGLYSADPSRQKDADFIPEVTDITEAIEKSAGATQSDYGRGGMITKIKAAKIAISAGCHLIIASGEETNALQKLTYGGKSTWFLAKATPTSARKRWIAGSLKANGHLVIDAGAARALKAGKSLLPAGVKEIKGEFDRGDAVIIEEENGQELARGLSAYSAKDATAILGRHSRDIYGILGFQGRDEMVHRDDLVLSR